MRGKITIVSACLSFALLIATAHLSVRSYAMRTTFRRDVYPVPQGLANSLLLEVNRGRLLFQDLRYGPYEGERTDRYTTIDDVSRPGDGVDGVWDRTKGEGFGWDNAGYHSNQYLNQSSRVIAIPIWLLCAAFGIIPAITGVKALRRRLKPSTLCSVCGYDLRAMPARCPECGEEPKGT